MVSLWFILTGVLLVLMAVAGSAMERLPVHTALIYLLIGLALGPSGLGLVTLDPASNAGELRIFCEVAYWSRSSQSASNCASRRPTVC